MIPIYRIWDKRTGKWMNVQEAIISNGEVYETWRDFEDGLSLTEDDYVFVHSTGLKDKNGVEIFEGDIIKTKTGTLQSVEYVRASVTKDWSETVAAFKCRQGDEYFYFDLATDEVIGNIYENPELLEVEV